MVKIRVHDLSKDMDLPSKEIVECLVNYGIEAKKTMSVLSMQELDVVFEVLTQKYDDGSEMEVYFKHDVAETIEESLEVEVEADANVKADEDEKPKADGKVARIVDTRANFVDLEKFDTEKIEKLVNELDDKVTTSQKITKKPPTRGKYIKPDEHLAKFQKQQVVAKKKEQIEVLIPDTITVGDLSERLKRPTGEVIKRLMLLGIMAGINEELDFDTASLVAEDFGATVSREIIVTEEDRLFNDIEDAPESLKARPPVVVVMGHVDHGKTSLLDTIRNANVLAGEAGGITQHIGAYSVKCHDRRITFLDTPGHAAFTSMRARGAQVTDVAIVVVAADDGIMPQTVEAIDHAKAANVPIIIAINKVDKENANPDRVMQELTEHSLVPEEWGGDTICVPISAKKNINIDLLLENVLLVSDMQELKANPDRLAKGTVVEAKLDKGRGPVATMIVQNGTLKTGDLIVAGTTVGHIRAMTDDKGNKITEAGPSAPVEILGLSTVPSGGDLFYAVEDERMAKTVVAKRKQKEKDDEFSSRAKVTLDDLFDQISAGIKELAIIVKADVQGSVEAVRQSLEKLENEEVKVKIIHGGVGAINESDVMLADASNAIIVGFNVRPVPSATAMAEAKGVEMRTYRIIYEAIQEIEAAMRGMLEPKFKEVITGHAEIRQIFKVSSVGTIAGCYVTDGKIFRNNSVRVVRDGIVIFEGSLASLKRFKDDAKEVAESYECGIQVEKFNDIKEGDIIEGFAMEEIKV